MTDFPLFDIETRFEAYHRENAEIYRLFCQFTFEKINAGFQHFGAKSVAERLRWESPVGAVNDAFKINNIFVAFYARKFMRDYPEMDGFFRLRKSKADSEI